MKQSKYNRNQNQRNYFKSFSVLHIDYTHVYKAIDSNQGLSLWVMIIGSLTVNRNHFSFFLLKFKYVGICFTFNSNLLRTVGTSFFSPRAVFHLNVNMFYYVPIFYFILNSRLYKVLVFLIFLSRFRCHLGNHWIWTFSENL